jgi:hypothetical protein
MAQRMLASSLFAHFWDGLSEIAGDWPQFQHEFNLSMYTAPTYFARSVNGRLHLTGHFLPHRFCKSLN